MSKPDAVSEISFERTCVIMERSVLRWSSACRHDKESVKFKNQARGRMDVGFESI